MVNTCIKYHQIMSKGNGIIVQKWCKLQSTNLTLTFDLLTPKSIGVFLLLWEIHEWSIIIVCQKEIINSKFYPAGVNPGTYVLINFSSSLVSSPREGRYYRVETIFQQTIDRWTAMVKPAYPSTS